MTLKQSTSLGDELIQFTDVLSSNGIFAIEGLIYWNLQKNVQLYVSEMLLRMLKYKETNQITTLEKIIFNNDYKRLIHACTDFKTHESFTDLDLRFIDSQNNVHLKKCKSKIFKNNHSNEKELLLIITTSKDKLYFHETCYSVSDYIHQPSAIDNFSYEAHGFMYSPTPMLILDNKLQIISANNIALSQFTDCSINSQQRPGDLFTCINSYDGCGNGYECNFCFIQKNLINNFFDKLNVCEEFKIIKLDLSEIWLRVSYMPFVKNDNDYMVLVFENITDKKSIENRLYKNEELLNLTVENFSGAVGIVNDEALIISRSNYNKKILGYFDEEVIHHRLDTFISKEDHVKFWDLWRDVRDDANNQTYVGEFKIIDKSLKKRTMNLYLKKLNKNSNKKNMCEILYSFKDLSEIKTIDNLLTTESVYNRALLESTDDMICIFDMGTNHLLRFNTAFKNFIYSQFNVPICVGDNILLQFKTISEINWEHVFDNFQNHNLHKVETRFTRNDHVYNITLYPLIIHDNVLGISVFIQDVTVHENLKIELIEKNTSLSEMYQKAINTISKIGEIRDKYTAGHQKKVSELSCEIAKELRLEPRVIQNIALGALVHDIGKIYIVTDILNKPDKITDIEYRILQTHVTYSYEIVKNMDLPKEIPLMIYQHHERVDGTGYPLGLTGKQLLLESKILAVADVVDAITSNRPYRAALGINTAIDEIKKNKGSKYDENVVDACLRVLYRKYDMHNLEEN